MSIKHNTILQDCFNKYEISKAQENCDLDFDCDIQCLSDMFHENTMFDNHLYVCSKIY